MFRKTIAVSLAVLVLSVCYAFGVRSRVKAQETQTINVRVEDFPKIYQDKEPVKITRLYLGEQAITSGVDFQAAPDWIGTLKMGIKNVSTQPIKTVWLVLHLKAPNHSYNVDFVYGKDYWNFRDCTSSSHIRCAPDDITLQPGETATVSYNPVLYQSLQRAWQARNYSPPPQGIIYLERAVFDDVDKGWFSGRYFNRVGGKWVEDQPAPQPGGNVSANTIGAQCFIPDPPVGSACQPACTDCEYNAPQGHVYPYGYYKTNSAQSECTDIDGFFCGCIQVNLEAADPDLPCFQP